jgi:hypothetical protein
VRSVKIHKMVVGLILFCLFKIGVAEPNAIPMDLKYETSTNIFQRSQLNDVWQTSYPEIKYVGVLYFIGVVRWVNWVHETELWNEMSEAQRDLVRKLQNNFGAAEHLEKTFPIGSAFSNANIPGNYRPYKVLAVSEKDAQLMASAIVEWLSKYIETSIKKKEMILKDTLELLALSQKELNELEESQKTTTNDLKEKKEKYAKAKHGAIDNNNINQDTQKCMEEISYKLRTTEYELVGLQAKKNMIANFIGDTKHRNMLIKLEEMLIVVEIDLAEVLAQKNFCEHVFQQAQDLRNLWAKHESQRTKIDQLKSTIKQLPQSISRMENLLADCSKEKKIVDVYDNKVVIYKIVDN